MKCAREETRTPTDLTPTASETAAYTNFATRAIRNILVYGARDEIRTRTIARHPLKVVRLPISPPGPIICCKGKLF
jgi:hypothetical protein